MTYHTVTLPSELSVAAKTGDSATEYYYKGSAAKVAALAGKEAKVASVQVLRHSGTGAFETDDAKNQEALEQEFSVANDPVRFLPLKSTVWAGVTPGTQHVCSPIQIQFKDSGIVDVRVAKKWVEEFKGMKLLVACET